MGHFEIRTYPDDCLREKTAEVRDFKGDLPAIVKAMADAMYIHKGIGLAAPQVGLALRLLVIDIGEGLQVFANPMFLKKSKKKCKVEEGCLSLPGITFMMSRPEEVEITAQDIKGKKFSRKYTGMMARVLQHEADHLDGKLLIDYMNPLKNALAVQKLKKTKKSARTKDSGREIL
ncbi:MAG TPA: peptide deformylase [Candidatus Omnitrophota bacterium]|nr:peptide deformylase [Candidatus Omnitrophota bacterium]